MKTPKKQPRTKPNKNQNKTTQKNLSKNPNQTKTLQTPPLLPNQKKTHNPLSSVQEATKEESIVSPEFKTRIKSSVPAFTHF